MAILMHWASALLVIGLMIAGFVAAGTTDSVSKASLLRIHAPLGSAVLVLTVARIGWWLFVDTKPNDPAGVPHLQSIAAKIVHGLLYVTIIGMAGSGVAMLFLSGAEKFCLGARPARSQISGISRHVTAMLYLPD